MKSPTKEASQKKSSKPSSDDLKELESKWSQGFARLEAMLLAKTLSVPVEPVRQTSTIVIAERPFILKCRVLPLPVLFRLLDWSHRSPAVGLSPLPAQGSFLNQSSSLIMLASLLMFPV